MRYSSRERIWNFEYLKKAFTTTLIFVHPDFIKTFYLETGASNFALEVVLLCIGKDYNLHLIAFYSWKFFMAKIKCKIHNKELLAIVESFQE